MNSEELEPGKARLTWGDAAFGLEVVRWRLRRSFARHEILRRFLGLQRFSNRIAQPGLLLIEIQGLPLTRLQLALPEGKMPFLRQLLAQENYEVLPMSRDSSFARTKALSPLVEISSPPAWSCNFIGRRAPFNKLSMQTRAGLALARGLPFVHAEFSALSNADLELKRIDRSIRNLHHLAQLSPFMDYQVWLASASTEGPMEAEKSFDFAMLPANTPLPAHICAHPGEPLDRSNLIGAALHALGRQSIPRRPSPISGQRTRTLRVVSYNIHSCVGLDGKLSPGRIARIIRGFDPDIVALQEVDVLRRRSRGEDQTSRLARELAMEVAFCCTVNRANEKYGHALLARCPVEVIVSGLFPEGQAPAEPRGVLVAKAGWSGQEIYLANTHFGLGPAERLRQMETFLGPEWLGRVPADSPLIVCGDFNLTPASSAYQLIADRLKDTQTSVHPHKALATFPSPIPFSRIDFVFVSKHFEVAEVKVPRTSLTRVASDHLPLIVDLKLSRPGEPGRVPPVSGGLASAQV